jgi:hypothetical protein
MFAHTSVCELHLIVLTKDDDERDFCTCPAGVASAKFVV